MAAISTIALSVAAIAAAASAKVSHDTAKKQKREADAERQRQAKLEAKAAGQEREQAAIQAQEGLVVGADSARAKAEKARRASLTGSSLLTGGDTGLMKTKLGS